MATIRKWSAPSRINKWPDKNGQDDHGRGPGGGDGGGSGGDDPIGAHGAAVSSTAMDASAKANKTGLPSDHYAAENAHATAANSIQEKAGIKRNKPIPTGAEGAAAAAGAHRDAAAKHRNARIKGADKPTAREVEIEREDYAQHERTQEREFRSEDRQARAERRAQRAAARNAAATAHQAAKKPGGGWPTADGRPTPPPSSKKPKKSLNPEVTMRLYAKRDCKFFKVDDEHGIAYGWAIISKVGGQPYFDTQGDHIPMDACIRAAEHFMKHSRAGDEQHDERRAGDVPFCLPVTVELAKSLFGADIDQEGLVIGFKPYDKALLAKIKNGDRRGFSIGGTLQSAQMVAKHQLEKMFSFAVGGKFAKGHSASGEQRIFEDFQIDFISAVDWPAQEGALVSFVKSLDGARDPVLWMRKDMLPPKKPDDKSARAPAPQTMAQAGAQPQQPIAPAPGGPAAGRMGMMGMAAGGGNGMMQPGPNNGQGGSMGVPQPKLVGESDGHQHAISLEEVGENGVGYTGFGISSIDGASHRHAFVVHPDGSIQIAVNNGHSHNADGTPMNEEPMLDENGEPLDTDVDSMLDEDGNPIEGEMGDDFGGDGGEPIAGDETEDDTAPFKPGGKTAGKKPPSDEVSDDESEDETASPFASRKRRVHITGQNGNAGLASVAKENEMDPQKQIASLKKQLWEQAQIAELSDAQKVHFYALTKRDQDAFLEKSAGDRDADLAKALAADVEVYKCDDGTSIRKSHGQLVEKQARQLDAQAQELKKAREATEKLTFEKRASTEMKHYPGALASRAALLKSIETLPEEDRKVIKAALAAGDKALSRNFERVGKTVNDGAETATDGDPDEALDTLAKKYAKENKVSFHKAYEAVLETDEGQELYAASQDGSERGEIDEQDDDSPDAK